MGRRSKGKEKGIWEGEGKGGTLPPSSGAPRASFAFEIPFLFPFERLPRRLQLNSLNFSRLLESQTPEKDD